MAVATLVAVIIAPMQGMNAALSALLGGLVSALPNALFILAAFKYHGARSAKQIVNSFYKGEALKIGLSILLFSLVFLLYTITPLIFFAAYILAQMVIWFAPLIVVNK